MLPAGQVDTCKKDINLYVIIFSAIELLFVQVCQRCCCCLPEACLHTATC